MPYGNTSITSRKKKWNLTLFNDLKLLNNRYFVESILRMSTVKLKESLHKLIDRIDDEELLNAYLKIIEKGLSSSIDPIAGYTTKGEPITKSTLVKRVKSASARVKSGTFTGQEDLEKESENW